MPPSLTEPLLDQRIENAPPQSPTSSILSDPPQPVTKKRRVSSSSLSDADENDDDDDDDDDEEPLAARITMGSRSVPGKRSGKQAPGKKSKKSHTIAGGAVPAPLSEDNNSTAPTSNGKVNGINGHEPRIKQEDKMDEGQLNRLTAGIPMDTVGRSSAGVRISRFFLHSSY